MSRGPTVQRDNKENRSVYVRDAVRYKTVLCRTWAATGSCNYGRKCQFAHGNEDLRQRQDDAVSAQRSALASASTAPPPQMFHPLPPPYPPQHAQQHVLPVSFSWPEAPPMAAQALQALLPGTPTSPSLPMAWPEPAPMSAPLALPLPMHLPTTSLPLTQTTSLPLALPLPVPLANTPPLLPTPSSSSLPMPSTSSLPLTPPVSTTTPPLLPPTTPPLPPTTPPLPPTTPPVNAQLPTFLRPPPVAAKPSIGQAWRLQPYDDLEQCAQSAQQSYADSLKCNNNTGKVEILPQADRQISYATENVRRQISSLWENESEPRTPKCTTPICTPCASCADELSSPGHMPARQQSFNSENVRRQIDFLFDNDW